MSFLSSVGVTPADLVASSTTSTWTGSVFSDAKITILRARWAVLVSVVWIFEIIVHGDVLADLALLLLLSYVLVPVL